MRGGAAVLCGLLLLTLSSHRGDAAGFGRQAVEPVDDSRSHVEQGFATYYAAFFDGRTTASGSTFDNGAMVAAHPTLPFGTVVEVMHLATGKSVQVTIVDRGPAAGPRASGVIVDLSRAAADALDFVHAGRARVLLSIVEPAAAAE